MLRIPAALGAVALSLALAGSAVAADTPSTTTKAKSAKKSGHHKRGAKSGAKAAPTRTALTGDVKTQAEAAALAAVPGTVEGSWVARTCPNSTTTSTAAYEVHVIKADGTEVHVIEDASFAVIDTRAGKGKPAGTTDTTATTGSRRH